MNVFGCGTDHTKRYKKAKSLVIEDVHEKKTDASGVGLGATLLQVIKKLSCGYEEVPDNAILWSLHLPVRIYLAVSGRTAIYKEKHLGSCMGWRCSITTVLCMKYMS